MSARHVTTPPAPAPVQQPRTNASWLRRGDRATSPTTGPPPRPWEYWPRAVRSTLDALALVAALGALVAYRTHPEAAALGALAVVLAALVVAGWRCAGAALTWRHRAEVVRPLARAVAPAIGRHEHERTAGWLRVPVDFMDGAPVTIRLPYRLDGATRAAVEALTSPRLGGDVAHDWSHATGRRPRCVITPRQHPPARALYQLDPGTVEAIAGAPEPAPAIGLTTGGAVVDVDLDSESPHILVSAAPGGGKSTILRTITAQVLHHGGVAVIIDLKRRSHRWAKGLPNVIYARDVAEAHAVLVAVGAEVDRRNVLADELDDDLDVPRLLVLVEESNTTISRIKRYHERTRERGGPKTSPALDALGETLFMGRAARVHVLMVAQSGTAAALGGPEVRECFAAARILSRYSRNAWAMLAPEHAHMPASHHTGRVAVITAGHTPRPVQVIHLDDDQARELATSGVVTSSRPITDPHDQDIRPVTVTPGTVTAVWATPPDGRPHLELVEGAGPELLTLAEVARRGIVPLRADNLRQLKRRDPEFPAPAAGSGRRARYTAEAIARWHRNRERTPPSDAGPELHAVEGSE